MPGLLSGYARVSTDEQDLTALRDALETLGVGIDPVYVDHGLTGTNRERPGLRQAVAACRHGDTLVVTKVDRLARGRCPTRATSSRSSPSARSTSPWPVRSTTPPTRRSAPLQRSSDGRRV